ncbi:uncharacterized protein LOC118288900 isoform X2 [Scophthalmus maximus]|uniref:uncharacterized protein LOC118288900 isoform X2 n=1 Tax=Scophthalmus maximus TaxID=52904 RepID=UPI0015E0C95D|nr:uncharacterized protein LOC118288900 isoform X2 [Scophthalmus maximus]
MTSLVVATRGSSCCVPVYLGTRTTDVAVVIFFLPPSRNSTRRTQQPEPGVEESDCVDDAAAADADADTSPGEKEDIELLEQALEKALRIRTGFGTSKTDPDRHKQSRPVKELGASVVTSQSSAPSTGSQSTSKSASITRKDHKKPGLSVSSTRGSRRSASNNPRQSKTTHKRSTIQNNPVSSAEVVHHQAARKLQGAGSAFGTLDHISTLHSKNKTIKRSVLSVDDPGKSTPSPNNTVPFSHTDESGAHGLLQRSGIPNEQITKWKSLRNKQNRLTRIYLLILSEYYTYSTVLFSFALSFLLYINFRLWDKVFALQRNPVPESSYFMERMTTTFPKDWPCGSLDQTTAPDDKLIHLGHELTHPCQTKEPLAKVTPEAATELGTRKNKYDSCLTADPVTQELETWDRWRPGGGPLCPTGANSLWEDGMITPLPLTITYTTEAELQELEKLRMRVALLQQEINLEQALLENLSPQLSSIAPGPGCPNPSVLRDMYSLLGEGGERFPATVLDSESD